MTASPAKRSPHYGRFYPSISSVPRGDVPTNCTISWRCHPPRFIASSEASVIFWDFVQKMGSWAQAFEFNRARFVFCRYVSNELAHHARFRAKRCAPMWFLRIFLIWWSVLFQMGTGKHGKFDRVCVDLSSGSTTLYHTTKSFSVHIWASSRVWNLCYLVLVRI